MVRPATFLSPLVLLAACACTGGLPAVPAPAGKAKEASGAKEVRDRLSKPVTLERGIEVNTPLRDVLEFISDRYNVTILVDTQAFKAGNVDAVYDMPVRLPRLIGVKLGTTLRLILAQVDGTYLIRSGHIEVTTWTRARPEFWTAEERTRAPTVNAEFDKRPLHEALRELSDSTGISVVLDSRAGGEAKIGVTATLNNVPIDTAVFVLADIANLKSVVLDNVLYVTTKENAEQLKTWHDKQRKKRSEPDKPSSPAGPQPDSAGKPK